jgi:aryl-alcohol dehydrogenase-like predicted oxidoreductase
MRYSRHKKTSDKMYMKKLNLGSTNVDVSAMCFGTMYFGTTIAENVAYDLLDHYVGAGGSFLDTANCYAHWVKSGRGGESELLLGRWMRKHRNRDSLFIATKVGFAYQGLPDHPGASHGLSRKQILDECEKSLKRLQIDTIDLYYAHIDPRTTPLEEVIEAMAGLVQAGKVRFIGASNYRAWRLSAAWAIAEKTKAPQFVAVQQKHTYLQARQGRAYDLWPPATDELFDFSKAHNIAVIAYSPLLSGAYCRDDRTFDVAYLGADNEHRLAILRDIARRKKATVNQIILA